MKDKKQAPEGKKQGWRQRHFSKLGKFGRGVLKALGCLLGAGMVALFCVIWCIFITSVLLPQTVVYMAMALGIGYDSSTLDTFLILGLPCAFMTALYVMVSKWALTHGSKKLWTMMTSIFTPTTSEEEVK